MNIILNNKDVVDIMITAIEGGIGYWACLDNRSDRYKNTPKGESVAETAASILLEGGEVIFYDDEDDEETPLILTLDKLQKGVQQFWDEGYDEWDAIDDDGVIDVCQIDSCSADTIIQLSLFGETLFC